jgi:hypothetical protein
LERAARLLDPHLYRKLKSYPQSYPRVVSAVSTRRR